MSIRVLASIACPNVAKHNFLGPGYGYGMFRHELVIFKVSMRVWVQLYTVKGGRCNVLTRKAANLFVFLIQTFLNRLCQSAGISIWLHLVVKPSVCTEFVIMQQFLLYLYLLFLSIHHKQLG